MTNKQKGIIKKVNEALENQIGTSLTIQEVRDDSDNSLVGYNCSFEWWSDLGEDLYEEFDIPKDFDTHDIWEQFEMLYDNFDVDTHVEPLVPMRGTHGVPSSIEDLVDDAKDIERTYKDIANAIEELL